MNNFEIKLLFEEHHRQLVEKRQKIHSTTERTLAILMVILGWLVISGKPITGGMHWIIAIAMVFIVFGSCTIIYRNNNNFYRIKIIIKKINQKIDLCKTLYPEDWEKNNDKGKFWSIYPHYSMIIATAILCLIALFMRAQ